MRRKRIEHQWSRSSILVAYSSKNVWHVCAECSAEEGIF